MADKYFVFFISDQTGITAQAMGSSLLTQFPSVEFEHVTIPYIDDEQKAQETLNKINKIAETNSLKPLVFSTIVNSKIREIILKNKGLTLDFFSTFLGPLEEEFGVCSTINIGKTHAISNHDLYNTRIDAVNYALTHDDGQTVKHYDKADVILVGVSRCGKTPTSLYLALQFGIYAANYPLLDEHLERHELPKELSPFKNKLYGLTIAVDRLHQIRHQRRGESQYASLEQCKLELKRFEKLMEHENINYISVTNRSVEEIATTIMAKMGLERRNF